MAVWHKNSNRKPTGGLHTTYRKSKSFEAGGEPTKTVIGPKKIKQVKVFGGSYKLKLRSTDMANVLDKESKTVKKAKILDVIENKANPHFIRQKIITKGALIKTDIGACKVTSRPGQNGTIDAVLVEKAEKK
ncbi:MAG: 30S ribosomal protein S8e [archaeon]